MLTYLEIFIASIIAGALDTVAGFGGGLLLIPILVLAAGPKDAILLSAIIPLGWNLVRIIYLRPWIDWRAVLLFSLGIVPGAIAGAHLFRSFDADSLRTWIGILLILFGVYYVARLYVDLPEPRKLPRWIFPVIGAVAGTIGALLGAGHGPVQAWGLAWASFGAREIAATNGALGGITALARVAGYGLAGELHSALWLPGAIGIAAGAGGAFLGVRLSRRSKDSTLELIIGIALILAGIKMVL